MTLILLVLYIIYCCILDFNIINVKNGDDYYVYNISNDYSYIAYLYKFHKSKKSYDKYIQKKENVEFYQLKTFDNSLVTREKYSSGSSTGDESIREKLINNIKKDDKNIYDILKNESFNKYEMLLKIYKYIK